MCWAFLNTEMPAPIPRLRYPQWSKFWAAFGITAPDIAAAERGAFDRVSVREAVKRSRRALWATFMAGKAHSRHGDLQTRADAQLRHILEAKEYYEELLYRYKRLLNQGDAIQVQDFINAWKLDMEPILD